MYHDQVIKYTRTFENVKIRSWKISRIFSIEFPSLLYHHKITLYGLPNGEIIQECENVRRALHKIPSTFNVCQERKIQINRIDRDCNREITQSLLLWFRKKKKKENRSNCFDHFNFARDPTRLDLLWLALGSQRVCHSFEKRFTDSIYRNYRGIRQNEYDSRRLDNNNYLF